MIASHAPSAGAADGMATLRLGRYSPPREDT
jgi:hypothetical protein